MTTLDPTTLRPGDWVYTYHDTVAMGPSLVSMEVVRVNRRTVTVRLEGAAEPRRINPAEIVGRLSREDSSGRTGQP